MPRPCHADHPPGQPGCTICRHCADTARADSRALRAAWGEPDPPGFVAAPRPGAPARTPLPCVHLGPATGDSVECPTCAGHVRVKLHACALPAHGTCTTARPVPGVACCAGCPDRTARPTLCVESRTNGIGDALLAARVAGGLARQHRGADVWLRCPAPPAPWARLFWPRVTTAALPCPTAVCADDKGAIDAGGLPRWRYWADAAGVEPTPPDPPDLPAAALAWAEPLAGRVLLAPFAAHNGRTWPLRHWLEVERRLVDHGFGCAVLDDRHDRCGAFAGVVLGGEPPARVAAALRYAAAFAGNDSGMAHVAGALGVPSAAVCHPASDRDIMGLYPRTEGLQAPRVTPADVVAAVLRRVAAAVDPDFPLAGFLQALHPEDAWRRHCWPPVYAALWRTVRGLAPRSVVEIGTRSGGSAWTILEAASPGCTITTIDLPAPGEGGVPYGPAHARQLLAGRPVTFLAADSRTLERLPVTGADLVYVDGGHGLATALSDLLLAERSGARAVLVDDYASHPPVRAAVARFLGGRPALRSRFVPSGTGLCLIEGFP